MTPAETERGAAQVAASLAQGNAPRQRRRRLIINPRDLAITTARVVGGSSQFPAGAADGQTCAAPALYSNPTIDDLAALRVAMCPGNRPLQLAGSERASGQPGDGRRLPGDHKLPAIPAKAGVCDCRLLPRIRIPGRLDSGCRRNDG